MKKSIVLPPDAKESGIKVRPPQGCEIDEVKVVDGFLTVTFKEKEQKLPKSWDEFCVMFPIKKGEEHYFNTNSSILNCVNNSCIRDEHKDKNMLPNRATAEAVLAMCQLIQLRNAYNGDWVPDWLSNTDKYIIHYKSHEIITSTYWTTPAFLYFKTKELRDEFLRNFRPLIEKLKPLYGIKEGGQND